MNLQQELTQFTSDGCTGFVNTWRNIDLYSCCFAHDMAWYLNPGDWLVWFTSNVEFAGCVANAGALELVFPAFLAVMSVGAFLFGFKERKRA